MTTGAITFRDIRRVSLLVGLNVTSHNLAHWAIATRSMFSHCAMTSRCFRISYKLVSLAKSRIFPWISFTISLIKSKNNNELNREP